jgi:hypothetical protein
MHKIHFSHKDRCTRRSKPCKGISSFIQFHFLSQFIFSSLFDYTQVFLCPRHHTVRLYQVVGSPWNRNVGWWELYFLGVRCHVWIVGLGSNVLSSTLCFIVKVYEPVHSPPNRFSLVCKCIRAVVNCTVGITYRCYAEIPDNANSLLVVSIHYTLPFATLFLLLFR